MNRIVIVGNGKKVLDRKKKEFVDGSTVVRMNNFKIEGYEDYVGTKTNLYSCAGRYLRIIDATEEQRQAKSMLEFNEYIAKYGNKYDPKDIEKLKASCLRVHTPAKIESEKLDAILYLWTKDKSTIKTYPFSDKIRVWDLEGHENYYPIYSTGMRTIIYCMEKFKDCEIFITGFDNFMSSGWYWDDSFETANKYILTQNYTDGHPYLLERNMLKELIKKGSIKEI